MYNIGIDLGGTNIAAGIVSEDGKILIQKSVPTLREREYNEIIKDMALLCTSLIDQAGLKTEDIGSIGIGSPGTPDPVNGVIVYSNNLKFRNTPIRDEIQKHIQLPVYIENDANCAALGESFAGAAKGSKNSVMLTLGTGLGGGIIIDGKIYSGSYFGGAEIGHHVICLDGEQCTCGRKGCWEAYSSATALIRDTTIAFIRNPNSEIGRLVDGDIKLISAKTPFDAAEMGDETAKEVINRYLRILAEGIVNIINIFQPEIIVIGGGVCYQGDVILTPLKQMVKELAYGGNVKTDICIATLGNDAGIIGAALLGR